MATKMLGSECGSVSTEACGALTALALAPGGHFEGGGGVDTLVQRLKVKAAGRMHDVDAPQHVVSPNPNARQSAPSTPTLTPAGHPKAS